MTWLGVPLVLEQWFKQTLYVSYYTGMISGSIGNVPVNKSRYYVLHIIPGILWDHSVTKQWIKPDTTCWKSHWLD